MAFNNLSFERFNTSSNKRSLKKIFPKAFSEIDLGIIYFSFQLISLGIFPEAISTIYCLGLVAALFPFYSIYKQAVVIKKTSLHCLSIILTLILQAIISLKISVPENDLKNGWLLLFLLFVIVTLCRMALRSVLKRFMALEKVERNFRTIRHNRDFFVAFYQNQEIIDDSEIDSIPNITIGNPAASVAISLIIDPINGNSRKYFSTLNKLLEVYPSALFLKIIFNTTTSKNKKLSQVLSYWIYNAYMVNNQTGIRFLQDILTKGNRLIEKNYSHVHSQTISHPKSFLEIHEKWCRQNNILSTPSILINNRAYPIIYDTSDLKHYIEEFIQTNP
jgi:hypothetical protein